LKLFFLGDSFTWGWGIDIEYGLHFGIINKTNDVYNKNIYSLSLKEDDIEDINDFRISNNWPALLSFELGAPFKNLSTPGSGIEMIYIKFLENEKNYKKEKCYIISLPRTLSARILVSSKNHPNYFANKNELSELFSTYRIRDNSEDGVFFKKYFDREYLCFLYLSYISNIIQYLDNKNIPYVILPSWCNSLKEQLMYYDEEIAKVKIFNDYFNFFIFDKISDSFLIDFESINKLPCGHPSIEGQKQIKEMYLKHPFFQKL
jgi:hypothetical protein